MKSAPQPPIASSQGLEVSSPSSPQSRSVRGRGAERRRGRREHDSSGLFERLSGTGHEDPLDVLVGKDVDALVCALRVLKGTALPRHRGPAGPLERCTDQVVRARPVLCGAVPDTEGRRAHRAGPLRVLVVWPFGVLSARDHQEVGAGRHPDGQRASVRSRLERQPWAAPVYGPARSTGTSTRMQRGLTPTWRSSWWLPGSIGDAVRRTDADVRRAVNRGSRCRPGPDFATPGYRGPRRAALTDATRIRVVARRLSAFRHAVRVAVGHTVTGVPVPAHVPPREVRNQAEGERLIARDGLARPVCDWAGRRIRCRCRGATPHRCRLRTRDRLPHRCC